MEKRFPTTMTRAVAAAAGVSALLFAGVTQAALQDRDLNGDTVVDAFYDTDLNITWLRNADVNGVMNWNNAVAWANGYSFGGYTDWRLPTSDACWGDDCTASEMGHLWYVELGNVAGAMTNTGSFQKLQSYPYWSGTEYEPGSNVAWYFDTDDGSQAPHYKTLAFFAMAVRPGDVAVVPEPQTCALLSAGLTALALARRQRPS